MVNTLVVLSRHVFAIYSPVIRVLVAKHPDLSNAPKRPVNGWMKHGFICLHLPPKDLTECMDIQANPGPSQMFNITDLRSSAPVSEGNLNYILPTSADRKVYNRMDLLALRSCKYGQETQKLFMRLKTNGIFRYRGPRRYQGWRSVKRKPIPTLSECKFGHARGNYSDYHAGDSQNKTVNFRVLRSLPKLKDPKPYDKPIILSANNHGCVSAPCRISSIFRMAGHNKPCPRSGGVNFNNLTSIQPAGTIQAVRSDLIRFALLNTRSIRKKAMFLKDYVVENQIDL